VGAKVTTKRPGIQKKISLIIDFIVAFAFKEVQDKKLHGAKVMASL
jgi:hypothetical protein